MADVDEGAPRREITPGWHEVVLGGDKFHMRWITQWGRRHNRLLAEGDLVEAVFLALLEGEEEHTDDDVEVDEDTFEDRVDAAFREHYGVGLSIATATEVLDEYTQREDVGGLGNSSGSERSSRSTGRRSRRTSRGITGRTSGG